MAYKLFMYLFSSTGASCLLVLAGACTQQNHPDKTTSGSNEARAVPTDTVRFSPSTADEMLNDTDLEEAIRHAVEKGVRPDQLNTYISKSPKVDTGTEEGRVFVQMLPLDTDQPTILGLRTSSRFVFWVLIKGEDRPVIGIYWDKKNAPHMFKGFLGDPK